MGARNGLKNVGIWIRVSTEDQVRGESPEHHERRARAYAEVKGWHIVEMYRLDATSGKTVKDLPETKRMLADVRSGKITGLIFSKLARLARNTKELLEFADFFREHDADLISLAESIDTSTPAGRLFYTMIAAMAQWEREEIAERVAASVPIRAKMGKSIGGAPPYGYKRTDGHLVPNPDEVPIRRLVYELFREHKRKKTVARILNERGHRTRSGALFTDTSVAWLIRDSSAKGIRRVNYTQHGEKRGSWVPKPESEWIFVQVEPIVSEELWAECNAILDARRATAKPPARRGTHLFTGLVVCHCGPKMYVPSNQEKYVCKDCRNKLPTADLEAIYLDELKHFIFSPEDVRAHLAQGHAAIDERTQALEGLEREHGKVAAEIESLFDLYNTGSLDKDGFGKRYHPLADRLRQLEEAIPQAQAALDHLTISRLSEEEILTQGTTLIDRWPSMDFGEKRAVVEQSVERVLATPEGVEITLLYSPQGPPGASGGGTPPPSSPSVGDRGTLATKQHRVIAFEELFRGTLDGASVHPREVVKAALRHNAAALILAHNHPSGVAEPSDADRLITRRLREALGLVDIRVLDHFVVGDGYGVSFAERGLL